MIIHINGGERGKLDSCVKEHSWNQFLGEKPVNISLRVYVFYQDRYKIANKAKLFLQKINIEKESITFFLTIVRVFQVTFGLERIFLVK